MGRSAVTMQTKDDRLETDYRSHPPCAYQQRSRGATFESLSKDAGRHGGVRTGEIFRNLRAECRCREMVFRGGGEIPPPRNTISRHRHSPSSDEPPSDLPYHLNFLS